MKVILAGHAPPTFLKPFRVLTQNQDKKNNFIKISGDPQTLKWGFSPTKYR